MEENQWVPNGQEISSRRKKSGLSVNRLAEVAKLSARTITDIEKDRGNPTITTLSSIASALKCELNEIATYRESGGPLPPIINDSFPWAGLEQAAISAVIAGGGAAMAYYRNAWKQQQSRDSAGDSDKNKTTIADEDATVAIIKSLEVSALPILESIGNNMVYLAEETAQETTTELQKRLGDLWRKVVPQKDFFKPPYTTGTLQIIVDAIDGTENFNRGIPLFCSATAMMVNGIPRIAAIYDPIHHVVFSAHRSSIDESGRDMHSCASSWQIGIGVKEDLTKRAEKQKRSNRTIEKAISVHFTRSRDNNEMIAALAHPDRNDNTGRLGRLMNVSSGIYSFNSGLISMSKVALGEIGAFINNYTKPWDVAAGEVLIKACGGEVTDFNGDPIRYDCEDRLDVVASGNAEFHETVLKQL